MKLFSLLPKLSIILVFLFIIGCNVTQEEAIEATKEAFEVGVNSEAMEPNEETERFRYYLPSSVEVEQTADTNLILSKNEQVFIVFSNPAETAFSTVNFDEDKAVEENAILVNELTVDSSFNYLIISPFEEDTYKVIVGVGGDKATTITSIDNLVSSVESMLEIVKSITY